MRPEIAIGEGIPLLAMYDDNLETVLAYAIPNKGECEYAIKRAAQDVSKILGYRKCIFKSDQEPALKVLLDRVSMLCGDQIIRENSPVGESASNGKIENAIQQVQRFYRTHKSAIEAKYDRKIEDSVVLTR